MGKLQISLKYTFYVPCIFYVGEILFEKIAKYGILIKIIYIYIYLKKYFKFPKMFYDKVVDLTEICILFHIFFTRYFSRNTQKYDKKQ